MCPLTDENEIIARQNTIEFFQQAQTNELAKSVKKELQRIGDIPKIVKKIIAYQCGTADWLRLIDSILAVLEVGRILQVMLRYASFESIHSLNHSQNNHSRTHRAGAVASARRRNLPVFVLSSAGLRSEAVRGEQGDVRPRRRGFLAGRVPSDPAEHAEHSGRMLGGHKAADARAVPRTRAREQSR